MNGLCLHCSNRIIHDFDSKLYQNLHPLMSSSLFFFTSRLFHPSHSVDKEEENLDVWRTAEESVRVIGTVGIRHLPNNNKKYWATSQTVLVLCALSKATSAILCVRFTVRPRDVCCTLAQFFYICVRRAVTCVAMLLLFFFSFFFDRRFGPAGGLRLCGGGE